AHVLAPLARTAWNSLAVESRHHSDTLALSVRGDHFTDLVFCAAGASSRFEDGSIGFTGELLYVRLDADGAQKKFLAVGATKLVCNDVVCLASDAAIDWVTGESRTGRPWAERTWPGAFDGRAGAVIVERS